MSSLATRTGDSGTTGLLFGQRVPKDHPQIEAVGACDELNAALGLARATCPESGPREELARCQSDLIALMGEVACAEADVERYFQSRLPRLEPGALARLDAVLAALEASAPPPTGWATPGATLPAAALDLARTAARRAERRLVALSHTDRQLRPLLTQYTNRLSDLLWLLARAAEREGENAAG